MGLFESFDDELEKIAISLERILRAAAGRQNKINQLRSAATASGAPYGSLEAIPSRLRERANFLEYKGKDQVDAIAREIERRGVDRAKAGTVAGAADAATAQAAAQDVRKSIGFSANNPYRPGYSNATPGYRRLEQGNPLAMKARGDTANQYASRYPQVKAPATWKGPALSVPKREKYLRGPVDPRVVRRAQRAGQPLNRGAMRMPKATPMVSSSVKGPFRKKMYQPDPFKGSK